MHICIYVCLLINFPFSVLHISVRSERFDSIWFDNVFCRYGERARYRPHYILSIQKPHSIYTVCISVIPDGNANSIEINPHISPQYPSHFPFTKLAEFIGQSNQMIFRFRTYDISLRMMWTILTMDFSIESQSVQCITVYLYNSDKRIFCNISIVSFGF